MCPVVFLAFLFSILLLLLEVTAALEISVVPKSVQVKEGDKADIFFQIQDTNQGPDTKNLVANVYSMDEEIARIHGKDTWYFNNSLKGDGTWNGSFAVEGMFLGYVTVKIKAKKDDLGEPHKESEASLDVKVIRKDSILSSVFIYSVATLVSLNYINMGCALDLGVVKSVLVKPVAPVIGFLSQFLVMPLVAYGVGKLLFGEDTILRLGLFTFGCSPGGGASNMWTVLLAGNLNLSITLTFISTACALFMMPFWLFTLGKPLFQGSISTLPYRNIFTSLIAMVVPLMLGLLAQRYLPKTAKFCRRIIAPASILMIIYIVAFGTYTNLYMFKIMSWRVILSAALNVWIGFLAGLILAIISRVKLEDMIAISIETGVQNTGIAIVLLGTSLGKPDSDLASVVPVAASIMTPIPLMVAIFVKKIFHCYRNGWSLRSRYELATEDSKQMVNSPSVLSSVTEEKVEPNGAI